jgi:hypothetical protein
MDPKLKAWLDTLTQEQRDKAEKSLGILMGDIQDMVLIAARRAAGLPAEAPKKTPDAGDSARRAAGLPDKE